MRKVIHKIRMQPPEFRGIIAVLLAIIMTSIIGYFWVGTLSTGTFQRETSTAPSPFNSLIKNIRDVTKKSPDESPRPESPNSIQVIDQSSGAQSSDLSNDTMYDESNPAPQY